MREADNLENISTAFAYSDGVMASSIRRSHEIFMRHRVAGAILELGPAEGLMTEMLLGAGEPLTVVEGSRTFCASLSERFPGVEVVHSLFEDYRPGKRFANVVLGHVLEHIIDPVALLREVASWVQPGGKIFAAVPNAASIHRQAAVLMGLLEHQDSLNESDLTHGHRRVFDPGSFQAVFRDAGLTIELFGGYWLKPLSNGQIESHWTPAMIQAFMDLGERYPDIAGEIYILASA
jgi:2-polyprenyl-3-methyl-5-hydroxy-6-metoxy-1,4-benzoquinol methylase